MVEEARLESVYTSKAYRGFESPSLRREDSRRNMFPAGILFFAGACTHTFTQDMTMEPMVDHCAQFMEEIKKQSGQNLTKDQAKEMMHRFSPNLKRWKK